jgi:hypothetical protein
MWATVRRAIIDSDEGSEHTVIRIEVDQPNAHARAVYEHWGFERADTDTSRGKPYDVLFFRP